MSTSEEALRAEVEYLTAKNTALSGCLADIAKHGLRADLMPTRTGAEETVTENEGWWYEYINSIDNRLREHAKSVLDLIEAADDEREVDAIAAVSALDSPTDDGEVFVNE